MQLRLEDTYNIITLEYKVFDGITNPSFNTVIGKTMLVSGEVIVYDIAIELVAKKLQRHRYSIKTPSNPLVKEIVFDKLYKEVMNDEQ